MFCIYVCISMCVGRFNCICACVGIALSKALHILRTCSAAHRREPFAPVGYQGRPQHARHGARRYCPCATRWARTAFHNEQGIRATPLGRVKVVPFAESRCPRRRHTANCTEQSETPYVVAKDSSHTAILTVMNGNRKSYCTMYAGMETPHHTRFENKSGIAWTLPQ